jgi:hypothetical protein
LTFAPNTPISTSAEGKLVQPKRPPSWFSRCHHRWEGGMANFNARMAAQQKETDKPVEKIVAEGKVERAKAEQAAQAKCDKLGSPRAGMTMEQVKATCWGSPDSLNHTITLKRCSLAAAVMSTSPTAS